MKATGWSTVIRTRDAREVARNRHNGSSDEKAVGEGVRALLTMAISMTIGYISYIRETTITTKLLTIYLLYSF